MAVDSTAIVWDVSRKWLTVSAVVVELGYGKRENIFVKNSRKDQV
jgi:hypothetical protein